MTASTAGAWDVTCPLEGFWQIVYDDPHDRFVPVKGTWTNVSLRRSGFMVYAGGRFLHIRTHGGRRLPETWPPSPAEQIRIFRTATGAAGICSWRETGDGWAGEHTVQMSPDPRDHGRKFEYTATVEDGHVTMTGLRPDGAPFTETWRTLSGPGSSPLAGAWESADQEECWMLLVTAGHYGVVRENLHRPKLSSEGELSDEEVLAICDAHGSNAGAIVVTATSFDNHPFVATNSAGYDAAKHPSFYLASVEADRLRVGFRDDGADASPWTRIG